MSSSNTQPATRPGFAATLLHDLPPSLVVFLVALPLSLGIAVASGATPQAGLIAATIGGLVVGLCGGAPLQVSGPAAGLTVMVYGYTQQFGLAGLGIAILIAGVLQMLGGWLRLARAALAISPAVLHAMLAGIGILIALGQTHTLLGGTPHSTALQNLEALPAAVLQANPNAVLVGGVTMACLLLWPKIGKRVPFLPGALVAILAGTLVSVLLPGTLPRVAIQGSLLDAVQLPQFGGHSFGDYAVAGLALFVVASTESLLCAVATDQLHAGPRANLDRELFAQGLGNTLSGLLGGLPVTGVIVRSSANIAAGARSKWSAVLHGLWMLVFVMYCSELLRYVPMAALAALLVQVGIKLVKAKEIRKVAAFGDLLVYAVTIVGVVAINLLWGIGLGFLVALVLLLQRNSSLEVSTAERGADLEVWVRGTLNFLAVPTLVAKLGELPLQRKIYLQFDLRSLDHAAIEALRAWRSGYERSGGVVIKHSLDTLWRELVGKPAA